MPRKLSADSGQIPMLLDADAPAASAPPKGAGMPMTSLIPAPPSTRGPAPRARRNAGFKRTSFVVGRLNRKTREMRLLNQPEARGTGLFAGPWEVTGMVGSGRKLRLV